jgi:hypothetical protein
MIAKICRKLAGGGGVALWCGIVTAATAATVPEVPLNGTTASVLGTVVAAVVIAAMKLRSKLSRDGVDRSADGYLKDALAHANGERDQFKSEIATLKADARAAWSSKNADALELGELRAQVKFLTETLRTNNEAMAEIRRGVQQVGRNVDRVKDRQDSTIAELGKSDRSPLGKT